jgi:hypothetical protein
MAMAHIILPVMGCLPAQLWLTLYCQWWVAYLLSYGTHCIASGGLLTSELRTAGKEHVCIASGGLLTYQLRTAGKEHVCIASDGMLPYLAMVFLGVLPVVGSLPLS